MDETDRNTRARDAKVLRAADVIPPFDKNSAPAETGEAPCGQAGPAASEPGDGDGRIEADLDTEVGSETPADPETSPSAVGSPDIPKYDLAENILAEQRRVAARRRRAPSQMEHEPPASPEQDGPKAPAPELPSEDLPELQRIVAEIVARDIERLCRRPER